MSIFLDCPSMENIAGSVRLILSTAMMIVDFCCMDLQNSTDEMIIP